ncbi:hypothetical protein VCV18_008181 [Metarhizium anisopliae]
MPVGRSSFEETPHATHAAAADLDGCLEAGLPLSWFLVRLYSFSSPAQLLAGGYEKPSWVGEDGMRTLSRYWWIRASAILRTRPFKKAMHQRGDLDLIFEPLGLRFYNPEKRLLPRPLSGVVIYPQQAMHFSGLQELLVIRSDMRLPRV